MTYTTDPLTCPHCNSQIQKLDHVLVNTRVSGMTLVACAFSKDSRGSPATHLIAA